MPKPSLTPHEFLDFLKALRDTKLLRVVGSYARGTQDTGGYLSDIDFHILKGDVGMKKIIAVFNEHEVEWDSCFMGCISTPRNADYMLVPIECSYLFTGFKTKPVHAVKIYGVEFQAYSYPENYQCPKKKSNN
jgi:hypothetical protein